MNKIAAQFAIPTPISDLAPLGNGLINQTFRLRAGEQQFVLQRINATVFPAPARIMANWRVLADHLAENADFKLRIPALIPTRSGADFVQDAAGNCWRMLELIENSITLPQLTTTAQARAVGTLLGRFHHVTATLPVKRLAVTLPDFHATPVYLARLLAVAAQNNQAHQNAAIRASLAFVEVRRELVAVLDTAQRTGQIAQRVTHGDPKLDNILFTENKQQALALIDLDTVQPGLLQHDLGDCLRSCCNRSGEHAEMSPPLEKGGQGGIFDLTICADILAGYAEETRAVFTAADIALIYDAIRLLPLELGMRFLTDHLDGNRYFRVSYAAQNLHRAQCQFALVADIERQQSALQALIAECFISCAS
ncbi:aminoglycoside phosphotransferase [Chromatium weissei]|nr:aminoglycoside phosphotransferase [Chromatium weissei]